jgi:SAM-dependent methyltransferase
MDNGKTNINEPEFWETRYRSGEAHWDLGTSTPVFDELLEKKLIDESGKIAILGCGKGHDALLFAKHDYLVTAVDFAPSALASLRKQAKKMNLFVETLQIDIFNLPGKLLHKFDYLLEYVTYCAIDPQRRKEYMDNISRLLKPGGILIGLFFPIDSREGGPPFSVDVEEITSNLKNNFTLLHSEIPQSSVKPRLGKEILMLWKKKEV